ncbi:MAG: phytanoyl-CoA dioxygenase family protein [Microthrixaceae bacterium]
MSVDVRTRVDGFEQRIEPAEFFDSSLPDLFEAQTDSLAGGVRWMDPALLVVQIGDDAWTLSTRDGHITVRRGDHGGSHLRLTAEALSDLVADLVTPMAWFISGALDTDARLEQLLDWWVLIRAALDGMTPYVPGAVSLPTFTADDGSALDLSRSFSRDDNPSDMARFLAQAGFVHIKGVFSPAQMATISQDMDIAAPTYTQGDGRSWWARTDDGVDRLVRMQGFDKHSDALRDLLADERFLALADLGGAGHELGSFGPNRIEALVKPLGVVEGISDVPWHKDCANGRHSYDCSNLTVGISVTGADKDSGQLRVVAGSNRVHIWPAFVRKGQDLPIVDLPTATGDVTIHLSCTTHMAQPPVTTERRVLYSSFTLPPVDRAAREAGVAKLREAREAAPVTVSQQSTSTGRI